MRDEYLDQWGDTPHEAAVGQLARELFVRQSSTWAVGEQSELVARCYRSARAFYKYAQEQAAGRATTQR